MSRPCGNYFGQWPDVWYFGNQVGCLILLIVWVSYVFSTPSKFELKKTSKMSVCGDDTRGDSSFFFFDSCNLKFRKNSEDSRSPKTRWLVALYQPVQLGICIWMEGWQAAHAFLEFCNFPGWCQLINKWGLPQPAHWDSSTCGTWVVTVVVYGILLMMQSSVMFVYSAAAYFSLGFASKSAIHCKDHALEETCRKQFKVRLN